MRPRFRSRDRLCLEVEQASPRRSCSTRYRALGLEKFCGRGLGLEVLVSAVLETDQ